MKAIHPASWSHLELELEARERALGEIGSALSHDLQEPVRNIRSFAKLLAQKLGDETTEETREMLDFLDGAADELGHRFHQLVHYTRMQTRPRLVCDPISTEEALARVLERLEAQLSEVGGEVTHGPLADVEIEPELLEQIFAHLLHNAIQCRSDRPLRIEISTEWRHGVWQIGVRDNGIGIEPRLHERAFQLFRQVHHERQGDGVGLAFCRQAIERSGGRMWLASRPGRGCSVIFTLAGPAPERARPATLLRAVK